LAGDARILNVCDAAKALLKGADAKIRRGCAAALINTSSILTHPPIYLEASGQLRVVTTSTTLNQQKQLSSFIGSSFCDQWPPQLVNDVIARFTSATTGSTDFIRNNRIVHAQTPAAAVVSETALPSSSSSASSTSATLSAPPRKKPRRATPGKVDKKKLSKKVEMPAELKIAPQPTFLDGMLPWQTAPLPSGQEQTLMAAMWFVLPLDGRWFYCTEHRDALLRWHDDILRIIFRDPNGIDNPAAKTVLALGPANIEQGTWQCVSCPCLFGMRLGHAVLFSYLRLLLVFLSNWHAFHWCSWC
jgi:hypothetical protein